MGSTEGERMKKFYLVLSVLTVIAFTGCSTIKGIGQDIKSLGNGIAGTAEKVQDGMDKSN